MSLGVLYLYLSNFIWIPCVVVGGRLHIAPLVAMGGGVLLAAYARAPAL